MKDLQDKIRSLKLVVYKENKSLLIILLIAYILWLTIGFTQWRHPDDWGPLGDYMKEGSLIPHNSKFIFGNGNIGDLSLLRSLKTGYGTLPPIWQLITLISSLFVPFSIDLSRYVTFSIGFVFLSFGSIFLSSALIHIFHNINSESKELIKNNKYNFLHIVVLIITIFNPEIAAHAPTYMPYYLPLIFTSISLNLLSCLIFNSNKNSHNKVFFIKNPYYIFSLFLISFTFGFQLFLILPCLFTSIIALFIFNVKNNTLIDFLQEIKKFLFKILNSFFKKFKLLPFSILLLSIYFLFLFVKKVFILSSSGLNVGGWATGHENIYQINSEIINIKLFEKIFFILSKICGLALYPLDINQDIASLLIFGFLFISFIFTAIKYKSYLMPITIFISTSFIINIFYAATSNYILAPSRHSIFLFPFYIYALLMIFYFLINSIKLKNSVSFFGSFLLCSLLLSFYYVNTKNAISRLKYNSNDYKEVLSMAKEADLYSPHLHTYYNRSADPFSNILLHDDKLFEALHPKYCSESDKTSKTKYKLFLYSFRHRIDLTEGSNMRKKMVNGCFPINANHRVISKIEIDNKADIEHDNHMSNGKSGLYAYLVEIQIK